jgi:hypothetical protein
LFGLKTLSSSPATSFFSLPEIATKSLRVKNEYAVNKAERTMTDSGKLKCVKVKMGDAGGGGGEPIQSQEDEKLREDCFEEKGGHFCL